MSHGSEFIDDDGEKFLDCKNIEEADETKNRCANIEEQDY